MTRNMRASFEFWSCMEHERGTAKLRASFGGLYARMDMEEDTYARAVVKRRSERPIPALTFEETGHPHDGLGHLPASKGACRLGGCS